MSNEVLQCLPSKSSITQFTGLANVYSRNPYGLAAIVRGLAIDNARLKVEVAAVHDFTDNSTGVAASGIVGLPIPRRRDRRDRRGRRSAHGAQRLARQAAERRQGDHEHDQRSLGAARPAGQRLGLRRPGRGRHHPGARQGQHRRQRRDRRSATPRRSPPSTSPPRNLNALIYGANAVLAAVGAPALKTAGPFGTPESLSLAAIPAAVAVAVGPGALAKADADAFLAAYANNVATLAAAWNAALNQGVARPGRAPRGRGLRPASSHSNKRIERCLSCSLAKPSCRPRWRRSTTPPPPVGVNDGFLVENPRLHHQAERAGAQLRPQRPVADAVHHRAQDRLDGVRDRTARQRPAELGPGRQRSADHPAVPSLRLRHVGEPRSDA